MGEDYVRGHVPRHRGPDVRRHRGGHQPQAQVRPIHRPPRTPADRHPHCAVDGDHRRVVPGGAVHPARMDVVAASRAHSCELDPIDPNDEGAWPTTRDRCCPTSTSARSRTRRWSGSPTRCVCRCTCWCSPSRSPCEKRAGERHGAGAVDPDQAADRHRRRRRRANPQGAQTAWRRQGCAAGARTAPAAEPGAYVSADVDPDFVHVRRSPAYEDGSWITLVSPGGGQAAAGHRARRSTRTCAPRSPAPSPTGPCASSKPTPRQRNWREVEVTEFSGGASWVFEDRKSLPLTVV